LGQAHFFFKEIVMLLMKLLGLGMWFYFVLNYHFLGLADISEEIASLEMLLFSFVFTRFIFPDLEDWWTFACLSFVTRRRRW
jgi:hypothetical protein